MCFIITQLGHTTRVQKKPDGLIRWSPSTESAPYISWHLTLEWGPPLHWTFPRVERSTTRGMDFLDLSAVVQKNDIRYAPVALYPPQSNTSSSLPLVVLINILKRRKKKVDQEGGIASRCCRDDNLVRSFLQPPHFYLSYMKIPGYLFWIN